MTIDDRVEELEGHSFTYDPVGNRTTSHLSTSHLHDSANRLLEDDSFTYSYDANGNRILRTRKRDNAQTRYTYDIENQLTQVEHTADSTQQTETTTYRYDALGRRIEKSQVSSLPSSVSRFVYDQEDIVSIYDQTGCWKESFTHGPGIDQPLGLIRDDSGNCAPGDAAGFREQYKSLRVPLRNRLTGS